MQVVDFTTCSLPVPRACSGLHLYALPPISATEYDEVADIESCAIVTWHRLMVCELA